MGKSSINFHTEDVAFTLRGKAILRNWINAALQKEKKLAGEINFIFCSDDYLLRMNKEYLNHNTFTDIITFDYTRDEGQGTVGQGREPRNVKNRNQAISGDIFISIDRVKDNAEKFGTGFANELHRVIIHGILHLAGYKDKSRADKALMTRKEDFYLTLLNRQTKRK
jgi:probable rRNA maturation factor